MLKPKKCLICGDIFIPTSGRQRYCKKPIPKICVVCGQEFMSECAENVNKTCDNPECKREAKYAHTNITLDVRKCKRCGQEFKPKTAKQQYCNKKEIKICPICGVEFEVTCSAYVTETCGKNECQGLLAKRIRENNLKDEVRICKWCGLEFTPKENLDKYCYRKHYKECKICGKQFEVDVRTSTYSLPETCSDECKRKLMSINHDYVKGAETYKKVLKERYGVQSVMEIEGVKDKIKATNLEKYGAEWYTQTDEYRDKIKETNLQKYGVEHHLQSKEIIEKRIETVKEKYGTENVFQSEEVKDKIKQTNLNKYGVEYATQSEDIQDKIVSNNIEKYGVKHPMMLKEFQDKAVQTNIERYGYQAYTQQHISNIQQWYEFIDNPRKFIETHYTEEHPTPSQLAADLGVDMTTVDEYLKKTDSVDCIRRVKSYMEDDITHFIRELDPTIRIISNTRSVIGGLELDIYLPDYKFAIECNPTATHNSSVANPWGDKPKSRKYHQEKTERCEDKGIFLLHVFGYDWTHKKPIILSMIQNILKKNDRTIYARKCKIKLIDGTACRRFLEENHRQGNANSPIRLGLFFEEELVSVMTFGKMRGTIGTGNTNLDDCWELVRFCSLMHTTVVGSASKLFSYFVKTYKPTRIRSFSDRAHTSGNLYQTLGFAKVASSNAGYVWVNVVSDKAYHRANAQKQNLKKFLKDENIDLVKTETEIMIDHGYVQVFDSGTITWEWQKSNK